ncbi:MAG: YicC family protein [Sedimentisphaerales bacterium]|nr:YicC family protein [Sedimentisphaerales bacterium]
MINSMTGYGQAQGEIDGAVYAVEVKTVNNRYFKTIIKLPELMAYLEEDIEKLLRNNLSRGTVNYVLRIKDLSSNALFDINEVALKAIIEKLNRAGSAVGIEGAFDIGSLLSLPGIVRPISPDEETAAQTKKAVMDVSKKAIDSLRQMRATEGNFLEAELKEHCRAIGQDLEQIRARSNVVVQEYAKKLRHRVDVLLAEAKLNIDGETLSREVAIYADRSDISEEIARMDSHLQQFVQCFQVNEQAGRRLDFISQEMLREANTIASKTSDGDITRCVVDMKCWIERIKEQIQNVE